MTSRSRLLALALVLAVAPASADTAAHLQPQAQKHLDAALQAYKLKNWDAAIGEFEQAYAIDPDTNLLYAIAQAYRFANDCTKALDYYRRYVASRQACAQGGDRTVCEAQVTAANTGIAACETAPSRPAPLPAKEPPPPAPAPAESSPPTSSPPAVTALRASPPPSVAVTVEGSPWYADRVGDVLAAGGVVGVGVGIGFLIESSDSKHAAESVTLRDEFLHDLDDATTQRRIGIAALGAGAVLAAGSVWFYLHHGRASRVVGATDGHSLTIAGSF